MNESTAIVFVRIRLDDYNRVCDAVISCGGSVELVGEGEFDPIHVRT